MRYLLFKKPFIVLLMLLVGKTMVLGQKIYRGALLQTDIYKPLRPALTAKPKINGPFVYGCRPGHPFLYKIPCQGERPIIFSAKDLPKGLMLNTQTGIITGTSPGKGSYQVSFVAKNRHGSNTRSFKIVAGSTLSLTPTMGWNSWYVYTGRVTDSLMRKAADAMISSGMADVGYNYINIDDCWANTAKTKDTLRVGPLRNEQGDILPNKHFPDMKGLTNYIHAKGLKAGIYSSPGPLTCGRYAGSYQHEAGDAQQFADWGFDLLKYDWCSYGSVKGVPKNSLYAYQLPYQKMGDLLKASNRDILFNLCQYGMGKVWDWGTKVGGQSWRTAGDLGGRLDTLIRVALHNATHGSASKPGSWNDPDYIQIGWFGGKAKKMLPAKQYTYMSMWCLMAAPLIFSGDMTRLDTFTLNVLCNTEIIDVDQDPLGESAKVVPLADSSFLMIKQLSDGTKAFGIINATNKPQVVSATFEQMELRGKQYFRDLWLQKNIGSYRDLFKAEIPAKGVVMLKASDKRMSK